MNHKIYIFFFILFLCTILHSQNTVIDSLKNELLHSTDTVRVDILNKLVEKLMYTDSKSSLKYSEEAVSITLKLKDNKRTMVNCKSWSDIF